MAPARKAAVAPRWILLLAAALLFRAASSADAAVRSSWPPLLLGRRRARAVGAPVGASPPPDPLRDGAPAAPAAVDAALSAAPRCGGRRGESPSDDDDARTPPPKNSALVFIKPHANTAAVREYVRSALLSKIPGVDIVREYEISGKDIDRKKLIDRHYYAIASKATLLGPDEMDVPRDKFKDFFGEDWDKVLREGRAANAAGACKKFGCDAAALNEAWRRAESDGKVVKLGGGFYCGLLSPPPGGSSSSSESKSWAAGVTPLYTFNAFFMSMRSKFVRPECSVQCYEIEWDAGALPWKTFRAGVLGPTDPSKAPRGSLRRTILDRHCQFGLDSPPNKGDNGVHGSASPFEGLAERCNWGGREFAEDEFGKALMGRGVKRAKLEKWSSDPMVDLPDGTRGSLFDALEDTDAEECLERLAEIGSLNQ